MNQQTSLLSADVWWLISVIDHSGTFYLLHNINEYKLNTVLMLVPKACLAMENVDDDFATK